MFLFQMRLAPAEKSDKALYDQAHAALRNLWTSITKLQGSKKYLNAEEKKQVVASDEMSKYLAAYKALNATASQTTKDKLLGEHAKFASAVGSWRNTREMLENTLSQEGIKPGEFFISPTPLESVIGAQAIPKKTVKQPIVWSDDVNPGIREIFGVVTNYCAGAAENRLKKTELDYKFLLALLTSEQSSEWKDVGSDKTEKINPVLSVGELIRKDPNIFADTVGMPSSKIDEKKSYGPMQFLYKTYKFYADRIKNKQTGEPYSFNELTANIDKSMDFAGGLIAINDSLIRTELSKRYPDLIKELGKMDELQRIQFHAAMYNAGPFGAVSAFEKARKDYDRCLKSAEQVFGKEDESIVMSAAYVVFERQYGNYHGAEARLVAIRNAKKTYEGCLREAEQKIGGDKNDPLVKSAALLLFEKRCTSLDEAEGKARELGGNVKSLYQFTPENLELTFEDWKRHLLFITRSYIEDKVRPSYEHLEKLERGA
ncbi:MAG: hypothetical protein V1909_01155 [Candidatus Micrarchaeota archaeon]